MTEPSKPVCHITITGQDRFCGIAFAPKQRVQSNLFVRLGPPDGSTWCEVCLKVHDDLEAIEIDERQKMTNVIEAAWRGDGSVADLVARYIEYRRNLRFKSVR